MSIDPPTQTSESRFTLAVLRGLIKASRAVGKGACAAGMSVIHWLRSSARLTRLLTGTLITIYDLLRRARASARNLHPSGSLRVLAVHPVVLYILMAGVYGSALLYGLKTRTLAAENLERASIVYRLISAEAVAIIVETGTPQTVQPPFEPSGLQKTVSEDPLAGGAEEDREIALFTGEGALIRPNPSMTLRGARPRDEIVRYTVQPNDTMSDIAYQFNLSVRTLLWANSLNANSYIRPGDSLIIPQTDGVVHTIQRGDTLARIATRYRSTVEKIAQINNLTGDTALAPGTVITVPDGVPAGYGQPKSPARAVVVRSSPRASSSRTAGIAGGSGFVWPTTGHVVTQYFGWRHTGLDIDGNLSSPIFAAAEGTVEVSRGGWNGGYGNVIIIDHGKGIKTRYGHLSRLLVKTGAKVQAGQLIGIMGSTGRSTGSHLHFEVMIGGVRKNPLSYL